MKFEKQIHKNSIFKTKIGKKMKLIIHEILYK
jgi:hypothetical protein